MCTVTEPTLPTVPGWTFGTPTVNPAGPVTITTKGTTYEVIVPDTITRDTGSLKVSKVFDPKTSGFVGTFAIGVDCTVNSFDQTLNLAAGADQTISGIRPARCARSPSPRCPRCPAGPSAPRRSIPQGRSPSPPRAPPTRSSSPTRSNSGRQGPRRQGRHARKQHLLRLRPAGSGWGLDLDLADNGGVNYQDFTFAAPDFGTKTVVETVPDGWTLTGASCTGVDESAIANGVSFDLTAGADIVCTFTNVQKGEIIADKVTDPAADPQEFTFTPSWALPDDETTSS